MMRRLALLVAVLVVAASGCVEQDPRILPFAQPKFELQVGESIDVSVALSAAARKQMIVDVNSEFDGVGYDPTTLTYDQGTRVGSVTLTGLKSTRGVYQPVRFELRGTDTGNSLLVLVSNRIDPGDGGGDGKPPADGPEPDTTADGGAKDLGADGGGDAKPADSATEAASADGGSNG